MAGFGAIAIVAQYEMFYDAGLTANWWMLLSIPASLVIAVSGWVFYRFRQTQAMTLGQFLGDRYSQSFRVYAGVLAFVSGVINFGIFPAVGSRFLMVLAGFPETIKPLGLPTLPVLMVAIVAAANAALLPIGMHGAFFCLVLFAMLSTHDTYLHAWSSVLVRDVVKPVWRGPMSDRLELTLLRLGVVLVAALILLISLTLSPAITPSSSWCSAPRSSSAALGPCSTPAGDRRGALG
ncbi:MAG: hypothetical protein AAFY08_15730 [Planctomycetota bacterium]